MAHHNRVIGTALIALAMAAGSVHADGKALYRWVDEKGQVHYGDKVPPKDSKQGRESINKQGTVTKVIPRELSGAELDQALAKRAAEKAAEEAHQQRIVYDRYLLQSFASVADLQVAREERLTAIDGRLQLAQNAVAETEKVLADLRARTTGKAPDAALKTQIESYEGSLIDNLQAVRKLRDERTATAAKFAADIERFKGLRAGTIRAGD